MAFGAAFGKDWNVEHCDIQTLSELGKLKGSKYAQSNMNICFCQVKTALEDGKRVLFSGTPCQVQGLKSYLGAENDNLLCVDLSCHGVASPKEWQRYLADIATERGIRRIIPRDKTNGMTGAPILIELEDGSCIRELYSQSAFLRGFNQNLFLRPACFGCRFKGIERCSDITIGDFWGVEAFYPRFASPLGVSVAMVHSQKGQAAFDAVSQSLERISCKADEVCKWNPCIVVSTPTNEKSEKYYQRVACDGMKRTVECLTRKTLSQRCAQLKSKGIALIYPIYAKMKPLLRR